MKRSRRSDGSGSFAAGQGEVYADPVLFGRAVSNLVDNAVHYTPDGGRIAISIASEEDRTEITVEDTGCGIGEEHISADLRPLLSSGSLAQHGGYGARFGPGKINRRFAWRNGLR